MQRLKSNPNLFKSFFEIALVILRSESLIEVNHFAAVLQEWVKRDGRDQLPEMSDDQASILTCENNIVLCLRSLCDLRRRSLGACFSKEELLNDQKRIGILLGLWSQNDENVLQRVHHINHVIVLTAKVCKLLALKQDPIDLRPMIDLAFFILQVQMFALNNTSALKIEKSEEYTEAYFREITDGLKIMTRDVKPKTESELYIYSLTRLVLGKLFLLRTNLMEDEIVLAKAVAAMAAVSSTKTAPKKEIRALLKIQDELAITDDILADFNLQEFPVCRKKLNESKAQYALSTDIRGMLLDCKQWRPVLFGVFGDLQDVSQFRTALCFVDDRFKLIMKLAYSNVILADHSGYLREARFHAMQSLVVNLYLDINRLYTLSDHYDRDLPEARRLDLMECCLRTINKSFTTADVLSINFPINIITVEDYQKSELSILLYYKPYYLLATAHTPEERAAVFTRIKDELISHVASHATCDPANRMANAQYIMEYYLFCLMAAESKEEKISLVGLQLAKTLMQDVHQDNKDVYKFLQFYYSMVKIEDNHHQYLFSLGKSKIGKLVSGEGAMNLVCLAMFLDQMHLIMDRLTKSNNDQLVQEVAQCQKQLIESDTHIWSNSTQILDAVSATSSHARKATLALEDFGSALTKKVKQQIRARLVEAVDVVMSPAENIRSIQSLFELAVDILQTEQPAELEVMAKRVGRLSMSCHLLMSGELAAYQTEANSCITSLKLMVQILKQSMAVQLGEQLDHAERETYDFFVGELCKADKDCSKQGLFALLSGYAVVTRKVMDILQDNDDASLLWHASDLLLDLYEAQNKAKQLEFNYTKEFTKEYHDELHAGFACFIEGMSSRSIFQVYINQLVKLLLDKLFQRHESNTRAAQALAVECDSVQTTAFNTLSAKHYDSRHKLFEHRCFLSELEELIFRFNLTNHPEYQIILTQHYHDPRQQRTPALLSSVTGRADGAARVKWAVRQMINNIHVIEKVAQHKNRLRRNKSESFDRLKVVINRQITHLQFDLKLLTADVKKLTDEINDIHAVLKLLKMFKHMLAYYSGLFSMAAIGAMVVAHNALDIFTGNHHKLSDYFCDEMVNSIVILLARRMEIAIKLAVAPQDKTRVFSGLAVELDNLLVDFTHCPVELKKPAARLIMEYYLECVKEAGELDEKTYFTPLYERVFGLDYEPADKIGYQVCYQTVTFVKSPAEAILKYADYLSAVMGLVDATRGHLEKLNMNACLASSMLDAILGAIASHHANTNKLDPLPPPKVLVSALKKTLSHSEEFVTEHLETRYQAACALNLVQLTAPAVMPAAVVKSKQKAPVKMAPLPATSAGAMFRRAEPAKPVDDPPNSVSLFHKVGL